FQAEDGIRDFHVTGVQTCALPICHAAGTGEKIDDRSVKAAMLVRLSAISKGYSGIHPSTILLLKDMINKDIIPVIPRHGGVGARSEERRVGKECRSGSVT